MQKLPLRFVFLISLLLAGQFAQAQTLAKLTQCFATEGEACASRLQTFLDKKYEDLNAAEFYEYTYQNAQRLLQEGHFSAASVLLKNAMKAASDKVQQAMVYKEQSSVWLYRGELDSALATANLALEKFRAINDSSRIGIARINIGQIQKEMGNYPAAMENYLAGLKTFRQIKNKAYEARALTELATLNAMTGEVQEAIRLNTQAAEFYSTDEDTLTYAYIILNLANDFIYTNRPDTAITYLQKAIPIFERKGDVYLQMNAEAQLGRALYKQGNIAEGIEAILRSNDLDQGQNFIGQLAYNHEYLSKIYLETGQGPLAIKQAKIALDLHRKIGFNEELRSAMEAVAKAYEKAGQADSALVYYRQYMAASDSLFSLRKAQQLDELKTSYEVELKEEQLRSSTAAIRLLEKQNDLKTLRITILILAIALILALGIGIISRQRSMMRLNQKLATESNKALEAKLAAKTIQQRRLQDQLEHKKRELVSQALVMAEKNEMIGEVKDQIKDIEERQQVGPLLKQLYLKIERANEKSTDWDRFMRIFKEVHPDYLSSIKSNYPQLTTNDLRLLALMRMNFSNKEIASILHISDGSLKKARYRLRKKMHLEAEADLTSIESPPKA